MAVDGPGVAESVVYGFLHVLGRYLCRLGFPLEVELAVDQGGELLLGARLDGLEKQLLDLVRHGDAERKFIHVHLLLDIPYTKRERWRWWHR